MKKVKLDNGLVVEINLIDSTSSIISAPKKYKDLIIPRSVQAFNRNYDITTIKNGAFVSCEIKSIEFPNDSKISTIEEKAFQECSIEFISFPLCIEKLEIDHKNSIKTITFHDNSILKSLFNNYSNTSIELIVIPSSVNIIYRCSFAECKKLKAVKFCENSQLNLIEQFAFASTSIECIQIPSNVTTIESYAFSNCESLNYIEFQKESKLTIIGKFAFVGCPLYLVNIPASVTEIQNGAFYYCKKLKSVEFSKDSKLKLIDEYAFSETAIKSLSIPSNAVAIKQKSFYNYQNLIDIEIPQDEANPRFMKINNQQLTLYKFDVNNEYYETLIYANRNIENITIPSYINQINDCSFQNCLSIKNINFDLHSQLRIIGNQSFVNSSITSISIPSSVTQICDYAFKYCKKLKKVTFSNDSQLISIGKESFSETSINNIYIPSSVKIIDEKAFANNKKLKSIKFSKDSNLDTIEFKAFSETMISEINIPANVTTIKNEAFDLCIFLREVQFPINTKIQSTKNAFDNCGIQCISFPPNIKEKSDTSIVNCSVLKSAEFLGDDISLSYLTFYKCFKILVISFPNSKKIDFKKLAIEWVLIDHDVVLFTNPNTDIYQDTVKLFSKEK